MKKRLNTEFFCLCFIAALIAEAYCFMVLEGDLFSVVGIGLVVLITGYLLIDSLGGKLKQGIENIKFYIDSMYREESEKYSERYTELMNIQKATYSASKKSSFMLEEQIKELQNRLELIEESNIKALQRIAELQKKSLEGQKNAINLEINYNKQNTLQLMNALREEAGRIDNREQLIKILEVLQGNHELLKGFEENLEVISNKSAKVYQQVSDPEQGIDSPYFNRLENNKDNHEEYNKLDEDNYQDEGNAWSHSSYLDMLGDIETNLGYSESGEAMEDISVYSETGKDTEDNSVYSETDKDTEDNWVYSETDKDTEDNLVYSETEKDTQDISLYSETDEATWDASSYLGSEKNIWEHTSYLETEENSEANLSYLEADVNSEDDLAYLEADENPEDNLVYLETDENPEDNLVYLETDENPEDIIAYLKNDENPEDNLAFLETDENPEDNLSYLEKEESTENSFGSFEEEIKTWDFLSDQLEETEENHPRHPETEENGGAANFSEIEIMQTPYNTSEKEDSEDDISLSNINDTEAYIDLEKLSLEEEDGITEAVKPTVVPLYSDPNKKLSPEEIAALFASFGQ